MGVDYYGVLKVRKYAADDELFKAYRRLAIKWHPDTHPDDKEIAKKRFETISHAYEVLRDSEKRKVYDAVGEPGVKAEMAEGFKDPHEMFKEVVGFSSPLEIMEKPNDLQHALEKVFNSALEASSAPDITCKAPPIQRKLLCTLEELYNGARKKVKISKNQVDSNGRIVPMEETLTIEVKPGWREGYKVTFQGKGNSKDGMLPSDVVFVIEEKPHELMKRKGDNLVIVMKVALVDALTGYTAKVNTLDGRVLMVPCVDVLRPSSQVMVRNEGMPIPPDPSVYECKKKYGSKLCDKGKDNAKKKGDLLVHFDIVFPNELSAAQKDAIRHALTELK